MAARGRLLQAAALIVLAAILATVVIAALNKHSANSGHGGTGGAKGLLVVVTFPNLVDDIRPLLCGGDRVVSLVPPGVDPHEFQLTPSALRLAREADLVVSTGHAPFEVKLRDVIDPSRLVEIPRIKGIRLLVNPVTGQPNYHMPIYDPSNYKRFIAYIAERLAALRPGCKAKYMRNAERILEEVDTVVAAAPRLSAVAVGSAPPVQYAVQWLNVTVAWLLIPEPGVSPTPGEVGKARSLLEEGAIAVVMSSRGGLATPADTKLAEMAKEYGRPLLRVPAPYSPGSVLEKLRVVAREAEELASQ